MIRGVRAENGRWEQVGISIESTGLDAREPNTLRDGIPPVVRDKWLQNPAVVNASSLVREQAEEKAESAMLTVVDLKCHGLLELGCGMEDVGCNDEIVRVLFEALFCAAPTDIERLELHGLSRVELGELGPSLLKEVGRYVGVRVTVKSKLRPEQNVLRSAAHARAYEE